ncbi:MAG: 5'-nucleotidase C-terminal domain-containing protein [Bacteroidia bacterium]
MLRSLLIAFFIAFFACCTSPQAAQRIEGSTYKLSDSLTASTDPEIAAFIAPYKEEINSELDKVIAVSSIPMGKNQPEGLLGNFVADLTLYITNNNTKNGKADFCFLNNGGLRSTLPKGDITIKRVYELMPFENELVILTLDGPTTLLLIEFIASKGGMPVSGIKMGINDHKPVNVLINDEPFDVSKNYNVVTSDYLANGGDNLTFLASSKDRNYIGIKVRDAIIKYMEEKHKQGNRLDARLDSRIYHVQ